MGDTNVEKRNIALNETNNQYCRQINKNEQVKITRRPKPRPIPDVIPRFPNELLNLQGKGNSQGNGMKINDGSRSNNSPDIGFTEQEKQFRGNLPANGASPYIITLIPKTVPQNQIPRVSYVQSVNPNIRMVDPVYSQTPYGYRVPPTVIRNPENLYWNQPQFYRSKPGSVYGIPPEPRVVQNDCIRVNRRFNIVLQPNAIRVFNGTNSNMQNIPSSPSKTQVQDTKTPEPKDIKVHIGGLLTLPRSLQMYSDESSQSSSTSSKDEESAKIALALPGMADFRKYAHLGCKDLEKIITQYNVKSSKVDLEEFCKTVRGNLASPKSGLIQMEPVMREIILAFLHISSSWVSLASLLPVSKDSPNPLDSSLEPLLQEFQQWQQVSKSMMEKITTALQGIPNEHERYISGAYKKQNEPEILSKVAEHWPTVKEWPKYQRQREIKPQPIPTTSKWNTAQNHPMCYTYPNEIPLDKMNNLPTNGHLNKDLNFKDWETNFGSTIIYPQHYGKKRSQDNKKYPQENNYFQKIRGYSSSRSY